MEGISRRKFLSQAGGGVAAVGAMSTFGRLGMSRTANDGVLARAEVKAEPHDGPLVVHIPDPRSDEVRLMFGTEERVRRDSALVRLLVSAAR